MVTFPGPTVVAATTLRRLDIQYSIVFSIKPQLTLPVKLAREARFESLCGFMGMLCATTCPALVTAGLPGVCN